MALWALAVAGGLAVLVAVGWLVWKVPIALYDYVPDPKDRAGAESATRTGLIAGLAGLAALGSLAVTARTYRITQQGHLTDRYTKAVAQLGDDKLDIRLGGIYALERLAVDSKRDHPTVVEVLSAYVRERTTARTTPRVRPSDRRTTRSPGARGRSMPRAQPAGRGTAYPLRLTSTQEPLSVDVQAALTVLGRLPARRGVNRADLSDANLAGANLSMVHLTGANLSKVNLSEADVIKADLAGASLINANLSEADLTTTALAGANLTRANLARAILFHANLTRANLTRAVLTSTTMVGANLTRARLTRANLSEADLTRTNLSGADLTRADLTKANLSGADLTDAILARANLRATRWDNKTIWPAGLRDEIRAASKEMENRFDENGFIVEWDPART